MLNHHPTPTAPCPPRPLFAMTWTKLNFPPHRHKYKQAGTHTRRHPHFQPFSILLHLDGCVLKSTHPPPSQPPIRLSSRPAAIWHSCGARDSPQERPLPTYHLAPQPTQPSGNHFSTLIFFINFTLAANNLRPPKTQSHPLPLPPSPFNIIILLFLWQCHSTIFLVVFFNFVRSKVLPFYWKTCAAKCRSTQKGKKERNKNGQKPHIDVEVTHTAYQAYTQCALTLSLLSLSLALSFSLSALSFTRCVAEIAFRMFLTVCKLEN